MKKLMVMALAVAMLFGAIAVAEDITVYVSISNGANMIAWEPVVLSDTDADGALTISDALYLAHEAAYEGGAQEGYGTSNTDWGLSLSKLWGIENGGSYSYYVNNEGAFSLADNLNDGDYVYAYVYTDLIAWSDAYSFFDAYEVNANAGDEIALTLYVISFDENWTPVAMPLAGAVITLDGFETEYVTDENGAVTIALDAGMYIISAVSDAYTLVPPICLADID